jgi:hypothetical protein
MDPSVRHRDPTVVMAPKIQMSLITRAPLLIQHWLHSNANAFRSRCVEQFLGCSHIRTMRDQRFRVNWRLAFSAGNGLIWKEEGHELNGTYSR